MIIPTDLRTKVVMDGRCMDKLGLDALGCLGGSMLCLLAACGVKDTDLGNLPPGSGSGSESGSESGGESGSESGTTAPLDCAGPGEDCEAGCCDGFGCDFSGVCVACTPEGESIDIDGAGCCEGLVAGPTFVCYVPTCDEDGVCPDDVEACSMLHPAVHDDSQEYARECAPEACLATRELVFPDGVGFECGGISGMCDGDSGLGGTPFQTYEYRPDPNTSISLRFDPAILDGYSSAAFNQHFMDVTGLVTIPDASVTMQANLDEGEISEIVYADGRVQFTVVVPLDDIYVRIESDAEDCLADDISGECYCYYEELGDYTVVVDLPIEAP